MANPLLLLVEDERDIAELTQTLLEQDGFAVMTASDGKRALSLMDALETCPPNVILTDLMMPVMDGLTFLREYRARRYTRVPVLAMSAMDGYLKEAAALGAAGTIRKPYDMDALADAVRRVMCGQPTSLAPVELDDEQERRRLRMVIDLMMDQPAPEQGLSEFVDRIARFFDVPVCFVTTITAQHQYWCVGRGIPEDLAETRRDPRSDSFCTHALAARSALVVQDAAENPFFRDNAWVVKRGLRFYAGVPLVHHTGDVLGTLCIIDYRPRVFTHEDLAMLTVLARRVLGEIEWRERSRAPDAPSTRHLGYVDRSLGLLGHDALSDVLEVEICRAIERRKTVAAVAVRVEGEALRKAAEALGAAFPRGWIGMLNGGDTIAVIVDDLRGHEALDRARTALGQGARPIARELSAHPAMASAELNLLKAELLAS